MPINSIRPVNLQEIDQSSYTHHLADCVILTHDNKILMQQRPENWHTHPEVLNIFGGHVEAGETILEGLLRELHEELGARIDPKDITFIGALSEDFTDHTELVHVHFWHDKKGIITGCYEAEACYFESIADALSHPKIMDYAAWALHECARRKFLLS